MSKKYFVWKDKNCKGINPEWIEMKEKEFYKFKKLPKNSDRYFIEMTDDTYESYQITIETTYEKYREYENQRISNFKSMYGKSGKKGIDRVSIIPMGIGNDKELHYNFEYLVSDIDVFELVSDKLENERFNKVLEKLNDEERALVNDLKMAYELGISERELAERMDLNHTTLHYRKKQISKKIKEIFEQN